MNNDTPKTMPVEVMCPAATGTNREARRAHRRCDLCGGTGTIVKYVPLHPGPCIHSGPCDCPPPDGIAGRNDR